MNLNKEPVLVTGGASGMGAATAEALAARGARVAILDVDETAAQAAAEKLGGVGLGGEVSSGCRVMSFTLSTACLRKA